ncbi:hypothetical protein [Desulfosoma caldarium]|uniref:hypothetical protein n=1 Tax=Desulfosoma caldarium TaxID=610254 RepID=UPI000F4A68BD|nr:hypothetical protein [Desulfosoma caldarium]
MEAVEQKDLKRHREKSDQRVLQIEVLKSRGYCLRGRELVLRWKTKLEAQGHKVSLRKVAEWVGVCWSTVNDKPRRRKPAGVDRQVEKAIYQLIQRYLRYGFGKISVKRRRLMGVIVNKKKAHRIMARQG